MKTAISIDDTIYNNAEVTAKHLGLSRSRFYALALKEYMLYHQSGIITDTLNKVYANIDSKLDEDIQEAQSILFYSEDW
jgi:hypothetical protein